MKGKKNVVNALLEICKGCEVLFIENDLGLYNSVGNFEEFCIEHKIQYHTVLDIDEIPIDSVLRQIEMHDIIVWESQYVSEVSDKLRSMMSSNLIHKKKLIECYIHEPNWFYLPEGIKHDLFILDCYGGDEGLEGIDEWEFYQLKKDQKAIWDKKKDEL